MHSALSIIKLCSLSLFLFLFFSFFLFLFDVLMDALSSSFCLLFYSGNYTWISNLCLLLVKILLLTRQSILYLLTVWGCNFNANSKWTFKNNALYTIHIVYKRHFLKANLNCTFDSAVKHKKAPKSPESRVKFKSTQDFHETFSFITNFRLQLVLYRIMLRNYQKLMFVIFSN